MSIIDLVILWVHYDKANFAAIGPMIPTSIIGMLVGQQISSSISDNGKRIFVAVVILCMLFVNFCMKCKPAVDSDQPKAGPGVLVAASKSRVIIAGVVVGLFGGNFISIIS